MKEVRFAFVGCGNFTYNVIYDYIKNLPCKLVSVCDLDSEKLKRFTERYQVANSYHDYNEMFSKEKLDAVICIADAKTHYEVAKAALARGISIFIEKAPTTSSIDAKELLELQKSTKAYAQVGFNRRFATAYIMGKEIIKSPEFGRKTMYLAKYNSSEYSSEEYFILNHVIHHLDIARYFLGEIKNIHTNTIRISSKKVGYHISFVAEDGTIGILQTSSLQYEPYPMERIEITGVGKNIIIDNVKSLEYNRPGGKKDELSGICLSEGGDSLVWKHNQGHSSLYSHYGFEREFAFFIDAVSKGTFEKESLRDTVKTMELYESFKSSLS
ncbi:MAG TPA: Gfo/Idh/MocA family oxidoreductase [Clostridiaceae bacterium]